MKKLARLLLRCLLWAALSAVVFLASCQESLIYFPRPYEPSELAAIDSRGAKRIEVTTSQGRQVAFYLPSRKTPAQPPEFLWLVFGGNGALALDYSSETIGWDGRFGYLFVDYPGYGLCEGRPNPDRIEESILALTEKTRDELHWDMPTFRSRTGVFGHSIGCAAGLMAADRLGLQRAVLCAPFTTMTDMAKRVVGWPLCYINRHRFDNIARLDSIAARGAQVRIFHGCNDEVIPAAMGRKLAAMFPKNGRFTEVQDCGHNEVVYLGGPEIGQALRELTDISVSR